jgi:hypothetical protein
MTDLSPEEARELWLTTLRSGEYKQGRHALRNGDQFCCLGVACDLYQKTTGKGQWSHSVTGHSGTSWRFETPSGSSMGNLLPEVAHWLGLSGLPAHGMSVQQQAADMNDHFASFEEIAAYVESYFA